MPVSVSSAVAITDKIVDWITANLCPLSIARDDGFLALMADFVPGYMVPLRTHLIRQGKARHSPGRKELAQLPNDKAQLCFLTMDVWSLSAPQSYNTLMCHFLNKDSGLAYQAFQPGY